MSAPVTLVLVGIFRSGTNYLRTLLELNYQTRVIYNAYGWKHGFVPIVTQDSHLTYQRLPTLTISRNPFSAIDALFRYVVKTGANISCHTEWQRFLRGRLVVFNKWDPESPQLWFPNPVHYWTAMNWNYLSAGGSVDPVCLVRYEDLLADPQSEATRIAARFNLERLPACAEFVQVENRVKNMGDQDRVGPRQYETKRHFDERASYLSHAYMDRFSDEDRSFIQSRLDTELIERMGYSRLVRQLLDREHVSA